MERIAVLALTTAFLGGLAEKLLPLPPRSEVRAWPHMVRDLFPRPATRHAGAIAAPSRARGQHPTGGKRRPVTRDMPSQIFGAKHPGEGHWEGLLWWRIKCLVACLGAPETLEEALG